MYIILYIKTVFIDIEGYIFSSTYTGSAGPVTGLDISLSRTKNIMEIRNKKICSLHLKYRCILKRKCNMKYSHQY